MKSIFAILVAGGLLLGGCSPRVLSPQQKLKLAQQEAANVRKIDQLDFTFYPETVTPEFGQEIDLGAMGDCYMQVSKTNIAARLPYLGHFYIRPVDREEIPVEFTSDRFVYVEKYDADDETFGIVITPQDAADLMNENMVITLTLDEKGGAKVSIKTDNRDAISYTGTYR